MRDLSLVGRDDNAPFLNKLRIDTRGQWEVMLVSSSNAAENSRDGIPFTTKTFDAKSVRLVKNAKGFSGDLLVDAEDGWV